MSATDSQKLKQLESQKAKLKVKRDSILAEAKEKSRDATALGIQLAAVDKQIKELKKKNIVVSEHAIIRYLERVQGVNMKDIKRAILNEKNKALVDELSTCNIPIGNGVSIVVKDRTVVTVK